MKVVALALFSTSYHDLYSFYHKIYDQGSKILLDYIRKEFMRSITETILEEKNKYTLV